MPDTFSMFFPGPINMIRAESAREIEAVNY